MSVASRGGVASEKKIRAPQTKRTIVRPNGMIVHASSSASEPSIGVPRVRVAVFRYLIANTTIRTQMSAAKKALIETRKRATASTCPESDEALSGNRGKL